MIIFVCLFLCLCGLCYAMGCKRGPRDLPGVVWCDGRVGVTPGIDRLVAWVKSFMSSSFSVFLAKT